MADVSEKFDWVTARKDCSLETIFEKLRLGVKGDVEKRQGFSGSTGDGFVEKFTFVSIAERFSATFSTPIARRTVIFSLGNDCIHVSDETDKELLRATVTLNNDKLCRLVINGEELEEWQFRKKALENLFFTRY